MFFFSMKRTSSNTISVTIERFGEESEVVEIEKGSTAGDALVEVGLPRDTEYRVNWEQFWPDDEVEDGDVLVVSTKKHTQG